MRYKLICLDIDGTLLTDKKELLPQVRDSIKEAAAKGIRIVLASGRMPAGVEMIEESLGIPCIKVCNAGTYIIMGEECISTESLLPATMKSVFTEIAKRRNLPLWIFREKKWYITSEDYFTEREKGFIHYQPEVVDAIEIATEWEVEGQGPNKLLFAADPETIQEIYHELEGEQWDDLDMACSGDTFLEIFPKGVTKGTALKAICKALDIEIEKTIAFGDYELDTPMLEAAGVGIAMGNAIEELKEKADYVTKTNNEAGISYALDKYLSE